MADFSPEHEGEIPAIPTEAELTLKKLLDKQLATTGRLEQVDFEETTESMHCIVHGSRGVTSRAQFLQNELFQKQRDENARSLRSALQSKGFSKAEVEERCQRISFFSDSALPVCEKGIIKRRRYGAHPSFMMETECQDNDMIALKGNSTSEIIQSGGPGLQNFGRHAKELEASLLRGKDRLQAISHLSFGGSASRKPLTNNLELSEICIGTTPEDRARCSSEQEDTRSTYDVFANRAPDVLDLYTYLEHRHKMDPVIANSTTILQLVSHDNKATGCSLPVARENNKCGCMLNEISEAEIMSNRLLEEEIRQLPCGKFVNYFTGEPSHILYIKNLSPEVTEADLAALFLRFQVSGQQLVFRLMQRGRMRGQAFITFSDKETAQCALQLINGYKLKGRPMVIEFGRASEKACS